MRVYITEVGTVPILPAPWSRLVSHWSFLQQNFILPQTVCCCAVQKMWLKSFLLKHFPSLSLAGQKFMRIIPTFVLIPSLFSSSIQLFFLSWWNLMGYLVLRASSDTSFSAQGKSMINTGEAHCWHIWHIRKGGVSVSWDIHLLIAVWQSSKDINCS